ncbi:MAG: hypothetical protein JJU29_08845 [Verrucomicrobia bacterium]|nr:hypothetical protein [Verrucomicrobiota bacterium]MCH8511377.1 hypothetical protein [Kiritimatiellia bacterium]
MKLQIGENILLICREIEETSWTEKQWADAESGDWFQYNDTIGGYNADERAFLLSYYDPEGEWWFQFSLADVPKILSGEMEYVKLSVPKRY